MSEQAIETAAAQALTPIAAALLEALHQAASAEITRLEAALPGELASAHQRVQDWADDAIAAYHRLVARIDTARGGAPATVTTPAATTPPSTPPAAAK